MIIDLFMSHVTQSPNKQALIFGQKSITYHELACYAANLSVILADSGMAPFDRVLVELDNSIDFVVLLLSAAHLKITLVPINPRLPIEAFNQAITSSGAKFYVSSCRRISAYLSDLADNDAFISKAHCLSFGREGPLSGCYHLKTTYKTLINQVHDADDYPYILTMTSGSTGSPKPIMLSQKTKINRAILGTQALYDLKSDERIIVASPMHHSLAQRLVLLPLICGYSVVILKQFSVAGWYEAVFHHKVTFAIMVSTHIEKLLQSNNHNNEDVSSLRQLVASSSPLTDTQKLNIIEGFQCQLHECYGASEVGIVTNLNVTENISKKKSVGVALDYVDLKIVDAHAKELGKNVVGEIICKTKTAFSGYYLKKRLNVFDAQHDYFHTGDLGWLDDEGYLYLSGRKKDLIKVSGMNVYAVDVERVIKDLDFIDEVAVIGVPHCQFGESIMAVMTIKKNRQYHFRQLKAVCFERLADFQQPLLFEVVDHLPKSSLGKILKPKLRESYAK